MSRDRPASSAARGRLDSTDDGDDSAASRRSGRAQQDKLDRAERIEASRAAAEQAAAEAKEARRQARAAKKVEAAPADEPDAEVDEEREKAARRLARQAARAAKAAAADADSPPPAVASPKASHLSLLAEMDRARAEEAPRFRRPTGVVTSNDEDDELTAAAAAKEAKARKKAAKAAAALVAEQGGAPRRRRDTEDETTDEQPTSAASPRRVARAGSSASLAVPESSSARKLSSTSSAAKPRKSTVVEADNAEHPEEKGDHLQPLPVASGLPASRNGSFSVPVPGTGTPGSNRWEDGGQVDWNNLPERNRVASIAAAQKSLDVTGLNRLLKNVPAVFFQKDNFNPFNHWNDPKEQLEDWREYVDAAVDLVTEAYHKGFNTATTSFGHVLRNFSDSQKIVKKLQENLAESKRLLQSRNQGLKDLYFQDRMADRMKSILEKILYVVEVPAWIETYMSRKQYVHATVLLNHTLGLLVSEDLVGVEGLTEMREEVLLRKHWVQQFLVEELHRIIYMKATDANAHIRFQSKGQRDQLQAQASSESVLSFNADGTRVRSNAPLIDTQNLGGGAHSRAHATAGGNAPLPRPTPADSKYSPFYTASSFREPDEDHLESDAEYSASLRQLLKEEEKDAYIKNPEANPSKFLGFLVEALDHMNHLPSVKTQINKRVRGELLAIITRETALAKERAKFHVPRRTVARATESGFMTQGSELLVDLIERIFHVLVHVLRNHLDVIGMIHGRLRAKGMVPDSSTGGAVASSKLSPEQVDAKLSIEGVWAMIQIVLQTTLTDFLHANEAASRSKQPLLPAASSTKSASRFGLGKKVVPDLLNDLTFSFADSTAPSLSKLSSGDKQPNARDYRAKSLTSTSLAGSGDAGAATSNWVQSTPYNICAVYRPVQRFTDHAYALIKAAGGPSAAAPDDDETNEANQLRNFLKIFVEVSFLPRVEADVNIRLEEVLNDPAAFDARELQRDARYSYNAQALLAPTSPSSSAPLSSALGASSVSPPLRAFPGAEVEHNLLFKCVLELSEVFKKNFQDMFLLPLAVPDFLRIVENSVGRMLDKCSDKYYHELVTKPLPGATHPTPQQLLLTKGEDLVRLMNEDPLFDVLRFGEEQVQRRLGEQASQSTFEELVSDFFSVENPVYTAMFKKECHFDRAQLQFDTRVWSQMSLMAESLEWMADRLFHMNAFSPELSRLWQDESGGQMGAGRMPRVIARRPGGKFASRQNGPVLPTFRTQQALERARHGDSLPQFIAGKSLLDQKRWQLAESCLHLADRCLFTLRLELHTHLFFFLKEMQSGSYWCANDSTEPEAFVLELNRDLSLIDDAISKYLATNKKKYVFGGCCELMTSILVRSLSHLNDKRVNQRGVSKICRNFFALQQNLTNIEGATASVQMQSLPSDAHPLQADISQLQETHFGRARQYYELLNYTQEELHHFELSNPNLFSADEYGALTQIQTQSKADGRAYRERA